MTSNSESGLALVSVLWVIIILSIIALSVIGLTQQTRHAAVRSFERVVAEASANAGIHRAIFSLLATRSEDRWPTNRQAIKWYYSGQEVLITIEPEAARIDLNYADHQLLSGLFLAVGADNKKADELADAIEDWRDEDDLRRLNGAERGEYLASGHHVMPANAPFETTGEVKHVLGITEAIYGCVAPALTVYSGRPDIDARTASTLVLKAAGLLKGNKNDEPPGQPPQTALELLGGQAFRITASVNNGLFVREAIVRITEDPIKPYWILTWREQDAITAARLGECIER